MSVGDAESDQLIELYLTLWWRKTRNAIVYRFVHRAGRLLELVGEFTADDREQRASIDAEIERVLTLAIGRPWAAHMTLRQRAIWSAAQHVCPDRDVLLKMLTTDKAIRRLSNVEPERALSRILKVHLDARRWEARGLTEHEARVWTKLLRVSTDLMQEYQSAHGYPPAPGYRCSPEHFKQIRLRILRDAQDDARIGRIKLHTIDEYFGRLCKECRELVSLEPWYEAPADDEDGGIAVLPSSVKKAGPLLEKCIDYLDERLRDVIRVAYYGASTTAPLRLEQLKSGAEQSGQKTLAKGEFERLRKEALRQLRKCLDRRISETGT
jgi:hypothetical protein